MICPGILYEEDWDSDKLREAVGCLVKDKDGKFDECLVDQFIKLVPKQRDTSERTRSIVMNLYKNEFKDVNPTRLFKFHRLYSGYSTDASLKDLNNLFWKRLQLVLEQDNPTIISAALLLLNELARNEHGYLWLMDKRFKRGLKLPIARQYEVEDAALLSRYFMQTNKNHHIQELARKLLATLVKQSCRNRISPLHRLVVSTKRIIKELLECRSPAIYYTLADILEEVYYPMQTLLNERYNLQILIRKYFYVAFKENSRELPQITKCFAMCADPKDVQFVIDQLRESGNLEIIVTYVLHLIEELVAQPLCIYFVYPILTKCDTEDAQVLAQKLFITREEKNFIVRNMKDKLVIICITYLKNYLQRKTLRSSHSTLMPPRRVMLFFNVLREYFRCNCNSQNAFRYVLECCSALKEASHILRGKGELIWLFELIEDCHKIIKESDHAEPHQKTILLETIQLLKASRYGLSILRLPKLDETSVQTMELAFGFDDPEILNEFADFFIINSFNLNPNSPDTARYVDLVWKHMRPKALACDHQEFLGRVVQLLISIDLDVQCDKTLLDAGIHRHHHVPLLIGDTLINYSTVHPIVELVIDRVRYRARSGNLQTSGEEIVDYLHFLDSGHATTLARHSQDHLDHIIKGLCVTVRGESKTTTRRYALEQICKLVQTLLINADDTLCYLKRLAGTGTLETIYEVARNTLYPDLFFRMVYDKIPIIRREVSTKINSEQAIDDLANQCLKANEICTLDRAREIIKFYTKSDKIEREAVPFYEGLEMDLASYLEDILNQQRISKGISECY